VSVVKKAVKAVGKFVKRYWKQIVVAAAIVFTCGLATVGTAGFSAAMGSASAAGASGVGAFFSAAGSTMVAGVASIGGTLGIGQGVTAATAGGAFASAPVMAGVAGGAGLTLGTGAAAQGLGMASSTYAPAASMSAGGGVAGGVGSGGAAGAAGKGITVGGGVSGGVGTGAAGGAAAAASGGFLSSPYAGVAIQAGMGLINGYMQARAADEEWERVKPRGFFGVGLNDTPSLEGPLPGAPRNAQGQIQPMWDANSFQRPQPPQPAGFSGNAALDGGQQTDPLSASPLNPDYDPTTQHLGGGRG
jgi:hypothetical protein